MAPRNGGGAARRNMSRDIPYLNNFPLYPTSPPQKPSLHLCFPLLPALTNSFRKHFTHSRNPSSASSTSVRSPGHLSLHDYRKYLSSSDTVAPNTPHPKKKLKRKARASNLNPLRSQPNSPYSSPSSSSTASSSSSSLSSSTTSTSTLSSPRRIVRRKPRTSNLNLARARFDPTSPLSPLSSPTTPPNSFLFAPSLQSPFREPEKRETADYSEDIVLFSPQQSGQGATRFNPHNIQLNPYQYRTWQIQNSLSLNPESSLDPTLIQGPGSSPQVTFRHREASFEILNPQKSLCRSQILSPEESKTNSLDCREMSSKSNSLENNSGAEKRPVLQPEDQQRRPTIPPSVFDELPTHPHQPTEQRDSDLSPPSFFDNHPARALQPEDAQRRPTIPHSVFDELPSHPHEATEQQGPGLSSLFSPESPPVRTLQPEDQQRRPTIPLSVFDELPNHPREAVDHQDPDPSSCSSSDNHSADTLRPDDARRRPSLSRSFFDELPDTPQQTAYQQDQASILPSPLSDRPARTLIPEDQQRRPSLPPAIFDELPARTPQTEHRQRSVFDDLPPGLQSEEQLRRPTPPRALFEDLPTAYTSITSRTPPFQQGKSLTSSPCADLPKTHSSLTRPDPLVGQPGGIPYSIPFSSLKDGVPPVMVGPDHELPAVTSPGVQSSNSSKEMARTLTRRVSKLLSMNGLSNKKTSVIFSARPRLERKPSSRPNKLVKPRPFSSLAHNKHDRDNLAPHNGRSSLTQELNWNQPNFHSARGRVDKYNKIDEIVRKRYSGTGSKRNSLRQSVHGPGSRLSTDFRYVNPSEVLEHQSETSSSKETFVEASETQVESAAGEAPDVPLPSPPHVGTRLQDAHSHSIQSELSSDFSYGNTQNLLQLPQGSSLARVNRLSVTDTIEEESTYQDDQASEPRTSAPEQEAIGIALTSPLASNHSFGDRNPYNNNVYANSIDIFGTHGSLSGETEPPLPIIQSVYDHGDPTALAGGVQDATSSSLAAPEVDDLGPGEHQSSSSQHLSQHGHSFWNMRPRIGGLKGLKANNPFWKHRDGNTSMVDPNTQRVSVSESVDREGDQMGTNKRRVDVDDGEEDDAADWETIGAESQIFPSEPANIFVQEGTASSLANYSSYGSFLPEFRTPHPLNPQVDQFSRDTTPFQSGRRGLTHSHRFHQESRSGRSVLPTDSHFPTIEEDVSISNQNVLAPPAPTLAATARNEPESLSLRGSRYKHPNPLNEPHKNPFQSTPPEIPQGYKAVKKTQGYPEAGAIGSELNESQNPEEYESPNRDQVLRKSDELVSSATAPRDITSFSSSAWITEVTSHTGPFPSPPSFHHKHHNNNITTTNTSEHPSTRVVTGGQADNNNSESLALSSYIHYSQGQPGPTRAREPSPTPMPPSQRLVREVSNLMSAAMSTSSTDRLLPATSVAKPSPGSITKTIRTARERFRASRSKGTRLEEMVREEEGRASQTSAGSSREPTAVPKPPPAAKTSRLVRHKTPHRDDLVRERLRRMESTVLADYLPSASSRTGSRLVNATSARTVGGGFPGQGSALSTVGDEEDPWFSVEEGHYVFSDPPRLLPVPNRQHSEPVPTIVVQGRLGRKLVWGSFLLPVFGMGVLLCIGMGVEASSRLMTWCSDGVVEEFHSKERALARRLFGAQAVTIMAVIIVAVVFSLKL